MLQFVYLLRVINPTMIVNDLPLKEGLNGHKTYNPSFNTSKKSSQNFINIYMHAKLDIAYP